MKQLHSFYINGSWNPAPADTALDIINPATETVVGSVAMGTAADAHSAIEAAVAAFPAFSKTTVTERIDLLERVLACYKLRYDEFADAIRTEMGAPKTLAHEAQAYCGVEHLESTIAALKGFDLEVLRDGYKLRYEPIGICGLITPWNWPINQIVCKVAPAIAAGCTVVLKPSEYAALSAQLFAEIMDKAGVPTGVFNMIFGDGAEVGAAISSHPDINMMSFTGSTAAGVAVAVAAAPTVKRVSQELGGKSPIVIAEDVDLETVIPECVWLCMENTGQSCNAGTRLIVPAHLHGRIVELAVAAAESYVVGDPTDAATQIGPLANARQYAKVTGLLRQAEAEGLTPATGGPERPEGITGGYFVRPTIFAGLNNNQLVAREEVFGPVLAILPYESVDEATKIANETPYGLSAYVYTNDAKLAATWSQDIRAGMVHINGAPLAAGAPFGGYKQSGNGREWGTYGLHEFLEVKAIMSNDQGGDT